MSGEGGLQILDGSHIRTALPNINAKERFEKNDEGSKGYLTSTELRRAAEAEAAALLLGATISSQILQSASLKLPSEDSEKVTEDTFASALQDYLVAIADALEGNSHQIYTANHQILSQAHRLSASVSHAQLSTKGLQLYLSIYNACVGYPTFILI